MKKKISELLAGLKTQKGSPKPAKKHPKKRPKPKPKPKKEKTLDPTALKSYRRTRRGGMKQLEEMFDRTNTRALIKSGRQRSLPTSTFTAAVCNLIRMSTCTLDVAVRSLGVQVITARGWVMQGMRELEANNYGTECASFVSALDVATAQSEIALQIEVRAGEGKWQRFAWMLEKRFGKRWGKLTAMEEIPLQQIETAKEQYQIEADKAGEVMAILEETGMLESSEANPGLEAVPVELTGTQPMETIETEEVNGEFTPATIDQVVKAVEKAREAGVVLHRSPQAAIRYDQGEREKAQEVVEDEDRKRKRIQRLIARDRSFEDNLF